MLLKIYFENMVQGLGFKAINIKTYNIKFHLNNKYGE